MKNKLIILLLVFTIILSGCGSKGKTEEKPGELKDITFVLDWTPNTNHTGIYVAIEKGYYEEAGLKVNVVQPAEGSAESLVGTDYAQFGISFQDYLAHAISGNSKMPVVAIAAILQHNHSGILSRKGDGIDRPLGLEGKTYATWDLPVEHKILETVMAEDGGDFEKVVKIPSTVLDEITALDSKEIDAVWVYYGWAGIAAEVRDFETDYFEFRDIDSTFDYYSPILITNEKLVEEDPELVQAFVDATKKGYEFAIENPEESGKILLSADDALGEELVKASQEWMTDKYTDEGVAWGYIDPERWGRFYKWLNDEELLEGDISPEAGFTNEFIK
ncbi:MAG: ABC transporter substrate-binding protein [Tissierellia bacterium]|nr:ABC transporter substrate-binding protein [Tissierellia bacterium]